MGRETVGRLELDDAGVLHAQDDKSRGWSSNGSVSSSGVSLLIFSHSGDAAVGPGVIRIPFNAAATIAAVRATANTAPTGAALLFDVNKNGTTVFTTQGNRPTIAISGNSSSAAVPDVTSVVAGDYLSVDIDQVGSTIVGADLCVAIYFA